MGDEGTVCQGRDIPIATVSLPQDWVTRLSRVTHPVPIPLEDRPDPAVPKPRLREPAHPKMLLRLAGPSGKQAIELIAVGNGPAAALLPALLPSGYARPDDGRFVIASVAVC
jgi:hypothetical protein